MSNQLKPNEDSLEGAWVEKDDRVIADAVAERIDWLITHSLIEMQVLPDDWKTIYQDPADGRFWEHSYPHSNLHGGGPPRLRKLPEDDASRVLGTR